MTVEQTPESAPHLFPRGVGDPFCPRGGLIGTSTDHRLLWHLASVLSVDAPMGSRLDDVRRDLRQYLNVRCEHHWHHDPAEGDYPEMWQCLWCCVVLMADEAPAEGICQPDDSLEYWPTVNGGSTPDPRSATGSNAPSTWRCVWCGQLSQGTQPPAGGCPQRSNRLHRWASQSAPSAHPHSCRCDSCQHDAVTEQESQR